MTKESNDKVSSILTSPVFKALGGAFLLGFAVHQFESKFDEFGDRVIKKIDEHILSDGFQKEALNKRIDELSEEVKDLKDLKYKANRYESDEFVRPDEPRIETDKRNRR